MKRSTQTVSRIGRRGSATFEKHDTVRFSSPSHLDMKDERSFQVRGAHAAGLFETT